MSGKYAGLGYPGFLPPYFLGANTSAAAATTSANSTSELVLPPFELPSVHAPTNRVVGRGIWGYLCIPPLSVEDLQLH